MLTVPQQTTKKPKSKQKAALPDFNPKPFSAYLIKDKKKPQLLFRRLSPFLISAMLLPALTAYMFFAGIHIFGNAWLQLFLLTGMEVYLLFLDFVLWNYYSGKNIARIWAIELVTESALLYFIL